MNYFILIFLLLTCVCYVGFNKYKKSKKNENFIQLNYKGRPIFNQSDEKCQRKVPRRIFSRPNKCFSCERELIARNCVSKIHTAFPTKCFSCERQSKNPYMTGPTKCFSCDN